MAPPQLLNLLRNSKRRIGRMSLLHNIRAPKPHDPTWLARLRFFASNLNFLRESDTQRTKVNIVSIQWLRGISAAMVVVLHSIFYYNVGIGLGSRPINCLAD